MDSFRCLVVEDRNETSSPPLRSKELQQSELPEGDVLIQVAYSSLNYKDALAAQGHPGVVKSLPHVPGIDAAGAVVESTVANIPVGSDVLVTGYDLGQGTWGGWSQYIRVPSEWVVPLPPKMDCRQAMLMGTAGFTAAQSVAALQRSEVLPGSDPIVVTGASGGVGSIAVALLAKLGYPVIAVSGKPQAQAALTQLGAEQVVGRDFLDTTTKRPILSAKWAGAIDTVGGDILTALLKGTKYGGCVTACGLVAGADLNMTLYPFLLRGVTLSGVASADCPREKRLGIWNRLASDWQVQLPDDFQCEVSLDAVEPKVADILAGRIMGRVLVRCSA